jgi:hypothetical protein
MDYNGSMVAKDLVPITCKILAGRILEAHRACMVWDDEVNSKHECSHLQDAQIVTDFAVEWQHTTPRAPRKPEKAPQSPANAVTWTSSPDHDWEPE